jgi:putative lipoic acid-binding regulatory protein
MKKESLFDGLRQKLEAEEWPSTYMFKFILPNDNERVSRLLALFGTINKQTLHESRNGNYVSITIEELMLSSDAVIHIYEEAAKIEGVMSL